MSVQDRLYLSPWKGHQEHYSWAVNRKKKITCWWTVLLASQQPAQGKHLRKRNDQRSSVLHTAADFWEDKAPALSDEIPSPPPNLQSWVSLVLWAGNGWVTWLLWPLFCVCPWVAFLPATLEQKRMQGKEKGAVKSRVKGAEELKQGRKGLDAGYHYPGFGYWSIPSTMLIIMSLARCIVGNVVRDGTPKWEFLYPQHCMSCWMQLCVCVYVCGYLEEWRSYCHWHVLHGGKHHRHLLPSSLPVQSQLHLSLARRLSSQKCTWQNGTTNVGFFHVQEGCRRKLMCIYILLTGLLFL